MSCEPKSGLLQVRQVLIASKPSLQAPYFNSGVWIMASNPKETNCENKYECLWSRKELWPCLSGDSKKRPELWVPSFSPLAPKHPWAYQSVASNKSKALVSVLS